MDNAPLEVMRACRLGLGGIVQIWCRGDGLAALLSRLVVTPEGRPITPAGSGRFQHGILRGGDGDIDEILLAWTGWGAEINCHGGSACATAAVKLLAANGVTEVSPEAWWLADARAGKISLCECEARLRLPQAVTPLQARLLANALRLEKFIREWITDLREENLSPAKALLEKWIGAFAPNQIILKKHLVALAGAPNVGKSTLFNALLALDRALVSEQAGTTRDAVRQGLTLGGLAVELADTAGLMTEAAGADAEAVRQAREIMQAAELCLLILDGSRKFTNLDRHAWEAAQGTSILTIINKTDLPPALTEAEYQEAGIKNIDLRLSALEDKGVARLAARVAARLGGEISSAAVTPADNPCPGAITGRQLSHLAAARDFLDAGDMDKARASLQRIILPEAEGLAAELEAIRKEFAETPQA